MVKRGGLVGASFFCLAILSVFFLSNCGGSGSRSDISSPDLTPPAVLSLSPPNGAENVPQNVVVSAAFSKPIQGQTISSDTFIVRTAGAGGGATVPGTWRPLDSDRSVVVFTPATTPFAAGTIFNITITTEVKDLAGNRLAVSPPWTFTTGTGFDNSSPSFGGNPWISASATSSTSIALSWNAATDATPREQLRYQVCMSTAPGVCKTVPFPAAGVVIMDVTPGNPNPVVNFGVTGLTRSTTYYFVVRAKDLVDLSDNNTFEVSAKTGGTFVSLGGTQNAVCTQNGGALCENDASAPSISVIGNTIYLAWAEANNVYVRTLDTTTIDTKVPHQNVQWSLSNGGNPINIGEGTASRPHIVSDGAAVPVPYIAYTGCNPGCKVIVKAQNGAGGWDPVGTPLNSGPAYESAIAFDGSNPLKPYVISTEADSSGNYYQVFAQHYDGNSWVLDGGGNLNVNSDMTAGGQNPSIAISNGVVKAAWSECTPAPHCELYVRTLVSNAWLPTDPVLNTLRVGDSSSNTNPNHAALAFINDGASNILNIAWRESTQIYVKKENPDGTFTSVGTVPDTPSSPSSISFGGTATIPQVPYLVFADGTTATNLFVKRWDGTNWVIEGKVSQLDNGSLNMASSGAISRTIDSAIAFLQGTPYIAWVESGPCNQGVVCGKNDGTHRQVYVKRLE